MLKKYLNLKYKKLIHFKYLHNLNRFTFEIEYS